jgi:hypothetical protein
MPDRLRPRSPRPVRAEPAYATDGAEIGNQMGLLERTTTAALVAAGIESVLVFPPVALQLHQRGLGRTRARKDAGKSKS